MDIHIIHLMYWKKKGKIYIQKLREKKLCKGKMYKKNHMIFLKFFIIKNKNQLNILYHFLNLFIQFKWKIRHSILFELKTKT